MGDRTRFPLFARNAAVPARRGVDDKAISDGRAGPARAGRELTATVTSRRNGREYRAPVHSRFTSASSGRGRDVRRLLGEGNCGSDRRAVTPGEPDVPAVAGEV
ncbi:hypothetical protein NSER024013_04620 [Nocardia seriolae]|nr:hypothetical protein NSER024013_04620 [Nocardia seriolae]